MRTVGQILKRTRLEKQIALEEVEAATKIRREYLRYLEEDDFSKLPTVTSARGFIKNYAEYLGISSKPILAIFRRDFSGLKKEEVVATKITRFVGEGKINWSPKLTLIAVSIVFFLGLIAYLGYQYFSLIGNPSLEVVVPQNDARISEEKIEVIGKASPDSLVTVNKNPVFLSPEGEFRYQLDLFPGENKIVVEAKSRVGKEVKIERSVSRLDKQD